MTHPLELSYDQEGRPHVPVYDSSDAGLVSSDMIGIHYEDGHMVVDSIAGKAESHETAEAEQVVTRVEVSKAQIGTLEEWLAMRLDEAGEENMTELEVCARVIQELNTYISGFSDLDNPETLEQERSLKHAALHLKHQFEDELNSRASEGIDRIEQQIQTESVETSSL